MHAIDSLGPVYALAIAVSFLVTFGVDGWRWWRRPDERSIANYHRYKRALRKAVRGA